MITDQSIGNLIATLNLFVEKLKIIHANDSEALANLLSKVNQKEQSNQKILLQILRYMQKHQNILSAPQDFLIHKPQKDDYRALLWHKSNEFNNQKN